MQLRQLEYFVAVAETLHFTRAAERTHVAQPTLSHQIAALESDLGAPLFVRRPANVELTAAAIELLPVARRILADADNARRVVAEVTDLKRGRVRLGATPSLCTGVVAPVVARFHRSFPDVAIVIEEGGSRDLQARLGAGELDLTLLVDSGAGERDGLDAESLFDEELVVISSARLPPPTRRPRIAIAELRSKQLVMFRRGYDLRESTLAACRSAGFEPRLATEGGEMDAVLALVAAGVGIAVVPASTATGDRFRVTPIQAPGLQRSVELVRRAGVPLSPAADALASRLRAITAPAVRRSPPRP